MRFTADSSSFFLSGPLPTHMLRTCAALALAATLAACGGGDGGGSAGSSGMGSSAGSGVSAKPDATTTDEGASSKKDDEVRYAP